MKLSGQRWSIEGAQNMLNLSVTYIKEKWDNVISMTKNNFQKTKIKAYRIGATIWMQPMANTLFLNCNCK